MSGSSYFAFGWLTAALTLAMPLLYLFGHTARRAKAWLNRQDPPKDRVGAYVVIAAMFGLITGSLLQAQWNALSDCHDQGYTGGQCLMRGAGAPWLKK